MVATTRKYVARTALRDQDVRALAVFLSASDEASEGQLQTLLKSHPALLSVLGFSEFCTEFPLRKDAPHGGMIPQALRDDRADLIASRQSQVVRPDTGTPYCSAHIVELKRASGRLAERSFGSRLSSTAARGVEQLKEYRRWLVEVPENRRAVAQLGWDVRDPMLFLLMGRDSEFTRNPGQLDEIRASMLAQGVRLFTIDDLLRRAARARSFVLPTIIESLHSEHAFHATTYVSPHAATKAFSNAWGPISGLGRAPTVPPPSRHNPAYREWAHHRARDLRSAVLLARSYSDLRQSIYTSAWRQVADVVQSDGNYWPPDDYDFVGLIAPNAPDAIEFLERSVRDGPVSNKRRAVETLCSVRTTEADNVLRAVVRKQLYAFDRYGEERFFAQFLSTIKYLRGQSLFGQADTDVEKTERTGSGSSGVGELRQILVADLTESQEVSSEDS
jgi:hypothetical protein